MLQTPKLRDFYPYFSLAQIRVRSWGAQNWHGVMYFQKYCLKAFVLFFVLFFLKRRRIQIVYLSTSRIKLHLGMFFRSSFGPWVKLKFLLSAHAPLWKIFLESEIHVYYVCLEIVSELQHKKFCLCKFVNICLNWHSPAYLCLHILLLLVSHNIQLLFLVKKMFRIILNQEDRLWLYDL